LEKVKRGLYNFWRPFCHTNSPLILLVLVL